MRVSARREKRSVEHAGRSARRGGRGDARDGAIGQGAEMLLRDERVYEGGGVEGGGERGGRGRDGRGGRRRGRESGRRRGRATKRESA